MKKKLLLVILVVVLVLSLTLAACQECEHNYVNGECTKCGEQDPNYQAPCEHNYNNGVCTKCGGSDPNYTAPTFDFESLSADIPQTAETPTLVLHYQRSNKDFDDWTFWIWKQGGDGAAFEINYRDDFGAVALHPLSAFSNATTIDTIGIIPRRGEWLEKDVDADRMLDLSECTVDENNYIHIYLIQGDVNLYTDINDMKYASTVEMSDTALTVKAVSDMEKVFVFCNGATISEEEVDSATPRKYVFNFTSDVTLNLEGQYAVKIVFADKHEKTMNADIIGAYLASYDSQKFADDYNYDGELGAIYGKDSTTFRVWSPVSSRIVLNIYQTGHQEETPDSHEMTKGEKGTFEAVVSGDLGGKYYTYTVYNGYYPNGQEIVDPYAKSAGLSGLRGMIVDFSKTNPDGWDSVTPVAYDRKELVVWETHVADVTSSATWTGTEALRKKFLGVIESGTTYTDKGVTVTTGFDHIKELGVNAVQLVPVFDQANNESNVSFNWGYNPLNYNVLEGAYSTDATDGYVRIREFKQLVQAFNGEDINIIMDVVYNHVNSATGSNFDVLMPGYYFRYSDSKLANGSGCGNETASERAMYRKFMIDSVCFWAEEYKLGGFRFDLMGLHDMETMELLVDALEKINPNIVVYGEPWTGGTSPLPDSQKANQANASKFEGYGQFNDQMRDALIKGGLNGASQTGWVTNRLNVSGGDMGSIIHGLKGETNYSITNPNTTVNYVTCHDNYTLYDRIQAAGIKDEDTVAKMAVLANSVVFTSNGTTFMLAGEEFLRTKNVDGASADEVHNSYQSSYKVNELNYALKIENAGVFDVYKKLIEFKTTCSGLHLEEIEIEANYVVTALNGGSAFQIDVKDVANGREYRIVHANGTVRDNNVVTVDFSGYTLWLDTLQPTFNVTTNLSAETSVQAYQTIIAYKTIG